MKNLLLVLAIISGCNLLIAQETGVKLMTFAADKIIYDGIELDLGMAESIAMTNAPTASVYFSKAKKMKTWNVVWSIFGGWEVGAGIINVSNGYTIGALDIAIGGGLIGMVVGRKKKIALNTKLGVDAFNEAVLKNS